MLSRDERLTPLHSLVKRADGGDEEALTAVRKIFDAVPELWETYGNVALKAQHALVELVADQSVLTREAVLKNLAAMSADLAGPDAPALERLLVQRVALCWLQSYFADFAYIRKLMNGPPPKELDDCQRRQDRAARQYLKALQTLALVRRLVPPHVQVNVAQQQVNITGR